MRTEQENQPPKMFEANVNQKYVKKNKKNINIYYHCYASSGNCTPEQAIY